MKRYLKDISKRIFLSIHKIGIRLGFHIIPVHYYSPVPNILELQKTKSLWAKKSDLPGISVNLDEQVNNLRTICLQYQKEYTINKVYQEGVAKQFGPGYGYIEAQALHAVIRFYKPKKIIEVGSGISTYCMLKAQEMNMIDTRQSSLITCLEPYPSDMLRQLTNINLISQKVQSIPIDVFRELEENDILFIDSSHTVKPGSDVNYLVLEVLPCLRRGVIIHFHDIFLPFDYQRRVLQTFLHWTETSLLRSFLIFNEKVKIIFCLSQLHYDRKEALAEVFPEYDPQSDSNGLLDEQAPPFVQIIKHFPCSIYIQIQ
jgi:predicted O-methyltransferase YrrM